MLLLLLLFDVCYTLKLLVCEVYKSNIKEIQQQQTNNNIAMISNHYYDTSIINKKKNNCCCYRNNTASNSIIVKRSTGNKQRPLLLFLLLFYLILIVATSTMFPSSCSKIILHTFKIPSLSMIKTAYQRSSSYRLLYSMIKISNSHQILPYTMAFTTTLSSTYYQHHPNQRFYRYQRNRNDYLLSTTSTTTTVYKNSKKINSLSLLRRDASTTTSDTTTNNDQNSTLVTTTTSINEQINGENEQSTIQQSSSSSTSSTSRYTKLLDDLNLHDTDIKHIRDNVGYTPRCISSYDIFCNRELKLQAIRAIGFDMDYTLAQYQQPTFDQLAFDGAKYKLVHNLGYPSAVLDFQYDYTFWTRGLIIDTQRGNFLKIDRHKYVRVAYHGFDRMSSPTRKFLYSRTFNKVLSFSEKHFVNMDTLFQFVDAHLFASLVQLKDEGEHDALDMRTYEELYRHVRECVDLCHRDGVIKDEVHRNPSKYIVHDKGLVPMLQRYRQQGMKLFLLTNSLWEYTSTAMNYLYHGKRVSDEQQKKNEWLELFDLVIVGSCKPAYMIDPYLNLFRVKMEDGSLLNTDGLYEIEALGENGATKFLQKGKTFQGGNWLHLQAMLEIEAGEEILYVGDHLYSDVLRSKRTLGWRSVFIMPELEDEMRVFAQELPINRQITALRNLRDEFGIYIDQIRQSNPQNLSPEELKSTLMELEQEDYILKQKLQELTADWHAAFHPIWGAMFNAGYQDSRFAFYVSNYACLYTSRATNLGLFSTARSFRTTMEALPHDRLLDLEPQTTFVEDDPWENEKTM